MQARFRIAAPAVIAVAVLIAGCAGGPSTGPSAAAGSASAQLHAARKAQQAGNLAAAWRAAAKLKIADLPPGERLSGAETKAGIALATHRPNEALAALAVAPVPPDRAGQARLFLLKGRALFAVDEPAQGLEVMVARGALFTESSDVLANDEQLWTLISNASPLPAADGLSATAQGWIALARIERTAWAEPGEFDQRIDDWRTAYPDHPAQELLAQIVAEERAALKYPQKIALLLPLTGAYAEQAQAVEAGLLAAYYRNAGARPTIAVYDTEGTGIGARAAFAEAQAAGADFVVGPLTPAGVGGAASTAPQMPVLALNYLSGVIPPPRFFQFGLSPQQEAQSAAEEAVSRGLTRAVVLVPANDWGSAIGDAFTQRLTALGGQVLARASFQPDAVHFETSLSSLFALDTSFAREQNLAATVGQPLGFTPRRREDIQFVFFAAPFTTSELIVPQIDYYQGIGLDVYSISDVYQAGATPSDLDGVNFPIMPWFTADDGPIATLRKQISGLFPNAWRNDAPLYALGYDAWRLIPLLGNSAHPLARPLRAMTGTLSLDSGNVIERRADWARYSGGKPKSVTAPQTP
ncbi:MAG: penicillin-binding protein activator [Gammaproteobacteria bacterium]